MSMIAASGRMEDAIHALRRAEDEAYAAFDRAIEGAHIDAGVGP